LKATTFLQTLSTYMAIEMHLFHLLPNSHPFSFSSKASWNALFPIVAYIYLKTFIYLDWQSI
jgi:hypothetical protein